ncbi:hypothetical protein Pr1d_49710 [Bythopirellula goksoeyrii]|uniref:Uncharacterized protein n=1 Tax=Bythopirellula goksoeyrii TaxID=1400387 RepID=A0A5B9QJB0_9BACT|nr:hypothetical protein Pr1d_49710 [Bythopirellula goksoeyrii]
MVLALDWGHVDREGPVVADLFELRDEFAVVDLALADADVEIAVGGITDIKTQLPFKCWN